MDRPNPRRRAFRGRRGAVQRGARRAGCRTASTTCLAALETHLRAPDLSFAVCGVDFPAELSRGECGIENAGNCFFVRRRLAAARRQPRSRRVLPQRPLLLGEANSRQLEQSGGLVHASHRPRPRLRARLRRTRGLLQPDARIHGDACLRGLPARGYFRYPLLPTSDLSPLPNASRNEATTASRSWRSFVALSSLMDTMHPTAPSL